VAIWETAINQLSGTETAGEALHFAGNSYSRLGDYQKAVQCYEKVINDYPMYHGTWQTLFMLADAYSQMKQKGLIPAEQADPKIRAAYQQIVDVYSESKAAVAARMWLNNNPL